MTTHRWRVSGGRSKMSWCIIVATRPVSRLGARSRSTSRSSITDSGDTPGSGIARQWHLPSSGPVNSRRREAATHGVQPTLTNSPRAPKYLLNHLLALSWKRRFSQSLIVKSGLGTSGNVPTNSRCDTPSATAERPASSLKTTIDPNGNVRMSRIAMTIMARRAFLQFGEAGLIVVLKPKI